jgi:diaminohydroxyphosphoribosylaminopyrimidine deaminase/5-amino-6-(5-phosphoribosylamino)uracil reductase
MAVRTETDREHLARAIELARRGTGRVSPNPLVGAVIVRDGEVLGEGWHAEFGGPHAEVAAIAAAGGADLTGATLYVSLEPCCHRGKTPPCTDAILAAGLGRVVVASDDPTEKAAGRGLGILRDEGVDVDVADGELAAAARLLNQAFRKHARTGHPWVLFKSAMVARRQGGHRSGRLEVDLLEASGSSPTAGAPPWDAVRSASARAGRRPAAHGPACPGCPASPAASFDSTGRLAAGLPARPGRGGAAAHRRDLPCRAALGRRRARDGGRGRHRGHGRTSRPACAPRSASSAPRHHLRLLEGGRTGGRVPRRGQVDEARCSSRRPVGGPAPRDPLEGEGVERIADASGAPSDCCRRVGRRRPVTRAAGVVDDVHGLVGDSGRVGDDATPRVRLAIAPRLARARRGRLDRGQRGLPDRVDRPGRSPPT